MLPWVLGLVGLVACAPPVAWTSAGSSIVSDGRTLWVASQDDDRVVAIDPDTLEELDAWSLPGRPQQLAQVDGWIVATADRGTEVLVLDTASGDATRVEVPCGGTRGVAGWSTEDGPRFAVTCPFDARVAQVDALGGQVVRTVAVEGRPTAAAVVDDRLLWTDRASASVVELSLSALEVAEDGGHPWTPLTLELQRTPVADGDEVVSQLDVLAARSDSGDVVALGQTVDNNARGLPPEDGSYGSVVDGTPRIAPRLYGACGRAYAVFDGGTRVFSGPSAVAWDAAHERAWVVHEYTRNVAVLDCSRRVGRGETVPVLAHFRVGGQPRGIALSDDGATAWVDDAADRAVSRLELPEALSTDGPTPVLEASLSRRRAGDPLYLGGQAVRGRALFHDATGVELTPSGILTCATCHPQGGDDGLTWFFHTPEVDAKLRRTPPVWGSDVGAKPWHWDGEFTDVDDLVSVTVRNLMGGTGLLVDAAAIEAWMAEDLPPVPRPLTDDEAVQVESGERVFEDAGCGDCHAGDALTDGQPHDVLAPSADPDGELPSAYTPSLRAVRTRAPFLHDGRAATLRDVLTTHNPDDRHGRTSDLDDDALAALIAFLETR